MPQATHFAENAAQSRHHRQSGVRLCQKASCRKTCFSRRFPFSCSGIRASSIRHFAAQRHSIRCPTAIRFLSAKAVHTTANAATLARSSFRRGFGNIPARTLPLNLPPAARFPKDLSPYALVLHCGGCMLNEKEMRFRQNEAESKHVPFGNYGLVIAKMNGILDRSLEILKK